MIPGASPTGDGGAGLLARLRGVVVLGVVALGVGGVVFAAVVFAAGVLAGVAFAVAASELPALDAGVFLTGGLRGAGPFFTAGSAVGSTDADRSASSGRSPLDGGCGVLIDVLPMP